jgi:hypothetical protein
LDEFDFVKLVHADDAAVVTTGAPGFTTKAGCVGGHFDREIGVSEKLFAVKVGDRDFGGGSEEKFAVTGAIHVVFKLRKLSGAFHALTLDEVGNVDFLVAVFLGLQVEEKLDKGALEAGPFASIDGEAGARKAGAVFEADEAVFLGEIEMVAGLQESGLFPPAAEDWVRAFVSTDGGAFVREIGDGEEEFALAGSGLTSNFVEGFDLIAEFLDLGLDARGVFAVGAELADFL